MPVWTVMFGDDPLRSYETRATTVRVKVFDCLRNADIFKSKSPFENGIAGFSAA